MLNLENPRWFEKFRVLRNFLHCFSLLQRKQDSIVTLEATIPSAQLLEDFSLEKVISNIMCIYTHKGPELSLRFRITRSF